jgi:hypothetical protein
MIPRGSPIFWTPPHGERYYIDQSEAQAAIFGLPRCYNCYNILTVSQEDSSRQVNLPRKVDLDLTESWMPQTGKKNADIFRENHGKAIYFVQATPF